MNLYEIESEILNCIDPETGEILDFETFDALEMERERKIENILLWIKNLKSDVNELKTEEKNLAERRKAAENKAERLTEYIKGILNGEKFQTSRVAVSYRKSEAVVVDDIEMLMACADDKYITFPEPVPDKTAIKQGMKSGEFVPGCRLEMRSNMTIK